MNGCCKPQIWLVLRCSSKKHMKKSLIYQWISHLSKRSPNSSRMVFQMLSQAEKTKLFIKLCWLRLSHLSLKFCESFGYYCRRICILEISEAEFVKKSIQDRYLCFICHSWQMSWTCGTLLLNFYREVCVNGFFAWPRGCTIRLGRRVAIIHAPKNHRKPTKDFRLKNVSNR